MIVLLSFYLDAYRKKEKEAKEGKRKIREKDESIKYGRGYSKYIR